MVADESMFLLPYLSEQRELTTKQVRQLKSVLISLPQ